MYSCCHRDNVNLTLYFLPTHPGQLTSRVTRWYSYFAFFFCFLSLYSSFPRHNVTAYQPTHSWRQVEVICGNMNMDGTPNNEAQERHLQCLKKNTVNPWFSPLPWGLIFNFEMGHGGLFEIVYFLHAIIILGQA